MRPRPAPDLSHITPEEWAFIAGFLEGEGCFSVVHVKRWSQLRIYASQVDPKPLMWIQSKIGGKVKKQTRKNPSPGQAPYIWVWQVCAANHVPLILRGIYPYLHGKKPQVRMMIRYKPNKALSRELTRLKGLHRV